MIIVRKPLILLLTLLLTGCVTPSLYQWGGYEGGLYNAYKDPVKFETLRLNLEMHVSEMEKSGQKVAPGLYAELGTLYLQNGGPAKAIEMYQKERDAWPESKGLMTAMIQNLERRQKVQPGTSK